jgi:hypothetical protein
MAMFWLSTALGVLGFAAIMLSISRDDSQLLGQFPESDPRYPGYRHSTDQGGRGDFSAHRYAASATSS